MFPPQAFPDRAGHFRVLRESGSGVNRHVAPGFQRSLVDRSGRHVDWIAQHWTAMRGSGVVGIVDVLVRRPLSSLRGAQRAFAAQCGGPPTGVKIARGGLGTGQQTRWSGLPDILSLSFVFIYILALFPWFCSREVEEPGRRRVVRCLPVRPKPCGRLLVSHSWTLRLLDFFAAQKDGTTGRDYGRKQKKTLLHNLSGSA